MSKIVIVNEVDEVLGSRKRNRVHEEGDWHRGVHVLLNNPKGEYFLQKRSEKKDTFPGRWDYSLPEHVQPSEKYVEAAIRGLSEELGIVESLDLEKLVKVKMNYGPQDNMIAKIFVAKNGPKPGKINDDEISEIDYFSKKKLDSNTRKNPNKFTRYFLEFYKWYRDWESDIEILEDYR